MNPFDEDTRPPSQELLDEACYVYLRALRESEEEGLFVDDSDPAWGEYVKVHRDYARVLVHPVVNAVVRWLRNGGEKTQ